MEKLGDKINMYYETLKGEKKPRAERMKEVAELIAPQRALNTEITDKPEESHLGENIYDGNSLDAVRKMVDGIFGNSVGPTSVWMEQEAISIDKYKNPQLDNWMRESDRKMFSLFSHSLFYPAIYQAIRDGVTLGNASILTRPHKKSISYKAINPFHYFFEEDEMNNLIIWMYRFPMTALKAWKMFGDDIPREVKEDMDDNNYASVKWYLYVVMENDVASEFKGAKPSSQMPYVAAIKLLESEEVIRTSGFNECPVAVWQYFRESGEKWGRGPGDEAYFDVRYQNRLSQSVLESAELRAAPPMQAPIEFKTNQNLKYKPKAINYYQSPERMAGFMTPGGDYMSSIDLLRRKDEVIGYHFLVDFWTMLSRSTKRKTAYEVSEEQSEKLALLSYAIQNFFSSFITPILERSYSIAMENEIIRRPEASWSRGVETRFRFNGLLAQAQRRSVEGAGMLRAIQEIFPVLEVDPNAAIVVDWEQFVRRRFEINNVEADMVRRKEDVEKIKETAVQQQQQQQQQQAVTEAAKSSEGAEFNDVLERFGGQG